MTTTLGRIYYGDTDAGGVVYYASYLRFLEQGRTEFLRARGFSLRALHERGYLLLVMRLEIDYLIPAVLDDLIAVETTVEEITPATCTLGQKVVRASDGETLVDARVTLACLGPGGKARRLPAELTRTLKGDRDAPMAGTAPPSAASLPDTASGSDAT
ncbi:MAG: YbgC/FadM family acyl-CoA thioesterase [Thermodesulfobacteriota bacterium]